MVILLAAEDGIGRTVAADNSAFMVGRPAGIGPGTGYEEVGDRTALDGPMEFSSGSEGKDGIGNRSPANCRDRALRTEKSQGSEQVRNQHFKLGAQLRLGEAVVGCGKRKAGAIWFASCNEYRVKGRVAQQDKARGGTGLFCFCQDDGPVGWLQYLVSMLLLVTRAW